MVSIQTVQPILVSGSNGYTGDGTTHKISRYQEQLFGVLKESLVLLIQQNETRRKVWFAAMNMLLYFITNNGQISRERCVWTMTSNQTLTRLQGDELGRTNIARVLQPHRLPQR